MSGPGRNEKGIWPLAAALALAVGVGVLALFSAPGGLATAKPAPSRPATFVLRPEPVVTGRARLSQDPTPLFLATARNVQFEAERLRGPGDSFGVEPERWLFPQEGARVAMGSPVVLPEKPLDTVGLSPPAAAFLGMGRNERPIGPRASRPVQMEVLKAGTHERVLQVAVPESGPMPEGDWRPLEFLVRVGPAGLVGLPTLSGPTSQPEVERHFAEFLANKLEAKPRLGERLAPGDYRVTIGP